MRWRLLVPGLTGIVLAWGLVARAENNFSDAIADGDPCPAGPCEACDSCGCDDFDCCDCYNDRKRLFGLFLPSDHCFDSFVSPLSNPFFFEDPRSLTEVRGMFINNNLPGAIGQGGDIQVWAAQARGRLTDRFSVIAPRLGYLQLDQGGRGAPIGFLSAPVGFKYNFIRDVDRQLLVSAGATYFIPGATSAFSGFGNGDFHFFLTAGKQIFDRGHWLSGTGFRIPTDVNFGTQFWYWSNQWDYEVVDHWYGLLGVNWFHWMSNSRNNVTNGITGLDLINLPTGGVAGSNVVTGLVGAKWKPSGNVEVGAGYEFPLTQNGDILNNRIYADLIFRY